ncbi:hypothetical protein DFQ29_000643, partial [Apophysomyces sp. BC1021]
GVYFNILSNDATLNITDSSDGSQLGTLGIENRGGTLLVQRFGYQMSEDKKSDVDASFWSRSVRRANAMDKLKQCYENIDTMNVNIDQQRSLKTIEDNIPTSPGATPIQITYVHRQIPGCVLRTVNNQQILESHIRSIAWLQHAVLYPATGEVASRKATVVFWCGGRASSTVYKKTLRSKISTISSLSLIDKQLYVMEQITTFQYPRTLREIGAGAIDDLVAGLAILGDMISSLDVSMRDYARDTPNKMMKIIGKGKRPSTMHIDHWVPSVLVGVDWAAVEDDHDDGDTWDKHHKIK